MSHKPKESDWKHYRSLLEPLRERYLKRKNHELVGMLTDPNKNHSDQFWDTLEQMEQEKRKINDCLGRTTRSNMSYSVAYMVKYGMLVQADFTGFSPELQERLNRLWKTHHGK